MLRSRLASLTLLSLATYAPVAAAQDQPGPAARARAVRREAAISVDGRLDEPAWAAAPRQAGFVQRFPNDQGQATVDTGFAVIYDDDAVYVGVWANDPRPDLIRSLITRRDVDAPADTVTVAFDSYHDRRTAYAFQLNAAGVQRDMLLFDDTNQDDTWDAVWIGNVAHTPSGWTAEYRIPLSQLRFATADTQQWGLQVLRTVGRTGEQVSWSPWPRTTPQVVSKFGIVEGIDHLKPATRLELLPYVTTGIERQPVDAGDPLNERTGWRRNVGLDVKYGLGPAFTLSATLNPDFGQVEADPSKVNLSANELFFAEKRPFFLEGNDLFRLQIGNSGNSVEGAFYSRRIGQAPAEPDLDYDYIKQPTSTTIYGAAKLTGKTASGWSVGLLDAVTGQETAEIVTPAIEATADMPAAAGQRQEPIVAPLTNYAIARVKRDLRDGNTTLGVSATAVNRRLDGTGLEGTLRDQAYTGGMQLQHRWADNAWTANVNLMGSWVHGTAEAITATQKNARHYFQRPDGDTKLDETRTSLSGGAAKWMIGQLGDTKHWRYGFGGDLRTPGLELNDAGFQQNSDRVVPFLLLEYKDDAPGDHILNWNMSSDVFWVHNFEPRLLAYGLEYSGNVQLSNYWQLSGGGNTNMDRWATSALRGGRALRVDPSQFNFFSINTDTRKPVWFSLNANGGRNWTTGGMEGGVDIGATIQARSNLDIFVGPGIYARNDPMQYVDTLGEGADAHYVFARIHQTDVAMTVRLNWAFSPHLTLQAYAQPFASAVHYSEFKDVNNPGAERFSDRFRMLAPGEYGFNEDSTSAPLALDRPDFNFRQLRSTLVVRWEYRPGSAVFAIWSHGQTDDNFDDGRLRFGRDLSALARADSENVVMVKANYWIGL